MVWWQKIFKSKNTNDKDVKQLDLLYTASGRVNLEASWHHVYL